MRLTDHRRAERSTDWTYTVMAAIIGLLVGILIGLAAHQHQLAKIMEAMK